jgi:hypothetical protein
VSIINDLGAEAAIPIIGQIRDPAAFITALQAGSREVRENCFPCKNEHRGKEAGEISYICRLPFYT